MRNILSTDFKVVSILNKMTLPRKPVAPDKRIYFEE